MTHDKWTPEMASLAKAIVRIDTHQTPPLPLPPAALFFRVVKAGFSMKRKQLKNALAGGLRVKGSRARDLLHDADLDPRRRAETLSLAEWARLTRAVAESDMAL